MYEQIVHLSLKMLRVPIRFSRTEPLLEEREKRDVKKKE